MLLHSCSGGAPDIVQVMASVDLDARIPNNVGLADDPKVANWIAAPGKGIGGQGPGFEYVRA
jgi:hypothetical protein